MPYWFKPETVIFEVGGRPMTIETGRLAKQAAGAALVTYGETVVLVTAVSAKPREGIDFFPLTVDFVEKTSAAGKIPGGFFKREGRLADREVLVSRFIDRSIRPLFPDGYRDETQITATVLSADGEHHPDIPAFIGASAALTLSDIPFLGPIAAVRIGRIDGKLVVNPLHSQLAGADVDLVVAGSRGALVMVEGGAQEVPERELLEALQFAHGTLIPQIDAQADLARRAGKPKREVTPPATDAALVARVRELGEAPLRDAVRISTKAERYAAIKVAETAVVDAIAKGYRSERVTLDTLDAVEQRRDGYRALVDRTKGILHDIRSELMRGRILDDGKRIDGRGTTDIRPIACEVRVVPRAHGTGALHPRRDAGAGLHDARQLRRRADHRRAHRALPQAVPAPLQLPAVLGGRGAAAPRARPARSRATATWPSARSRRCSRSTRTSRTRSGSCPRPSSPTARRPWRRSAAARCR